jgi:hypothetical protein
VQLVMPRLGEPIEPVRVDKVTPWWRAVDTLVGSEGLADLAAITLPKSIPWPAD